MILVMANGIGHLSEVPNAVNTCSVMPCPEPIQILPTISQTPSNQRMGGIHTFRIIQLRARQVNVRSEVGE